MGSTDSSPAHLPGAPGGPAARSPGAPAVRIGTRFTSQAQKARVHTSFGSFVPLVQFQLQLGRRRKRRLWAGPWCDASLAVHTRERAGLGCQIPRSTRLTVTLAPGIRRGRAAKMKQPCLHFNEKPHQAAAGVKRRTQNSLSLCCRPSGFWVCRALQRSRAQAGPSQLRPLLFP